MWTFSFFFLWKYLEGCSFSNLGRHMCRESIRDQISKCCRWVQESGKTSVSSSATSVKFTLGMQLDRCNENDCIGWHNVEWLIRKFSYFGRMWKPKAIPEKTQFENQTAETTHHWSIHQSQANKFSHADRMHICIWKMWQDQQNYFEENMAQTLQKKTQSTK